MNKSLYSICEWNKSGVWKRRKFNHTEWFNSKHPNDGKYFIHQ